MKFLEKKPLGKLFSEFIKQNNFDNMAQAVEYFSVFGGTDFPINTKYSLETTIENYILNKYKYLRNDINTLLLGKDEFAPILTGLALGDRRTNSAFKRANIYFDDGIKLVDELCDINILKMEKSLQNMSNIEEQYTVSEKLLFNIPFVRFWFAFISPIFKGIRDGNYDEFNKLYQNRKIEFEEVIFEQLSHELLKYTLKDDSIYNIGRYWDDDLDINLLCTTKSGMTIAGECKYTNSKVKKNILNNLKQKCKDAQINIDTFMIFSKSGFSSELKSQKGKDLKLFTIKSFKNLV
jgi:uncharacterized protein